ncbi:kelch-like protein 24a [Ptychodera flava]|uniref:kelch-like protein 24a n=1 Tax=Ptychodera flava TaxID=63121 RepID=UPI00396AAF52
MRLDSNMTDTILLVEGQEFPCHKAVLAASSQYFRAMFSSDLRESHEPQITLHNIQADCMKQLLEFSYTGKIVFTSKNAQDLLVTADFLQYKRVVHACGDFLKSQLDISNCLGIHLLAERHTCIGLGEAVNLFILEHFTRVIQQEEFFELSADDLICYTSKDELNVRNEEEVYKAVLQWVMHDVKARLVDLIKVMRTVRLPLLEERFFIDTVQQDLLRLLQKSDDCKALVQEAVNFRRGITARHGAWCRPRPSTGLVEVMAVVGGSNQSNRGNRQSLELLCFEPNEGYWTSLCDLPYSLVNVAMYSAVSYRNDIYVTGGYDGQRTGPINQVWIYKTSEDTWTGCKSLKKARYQHASTMLNGQIFVVGGYNGKQSMKEVEVYSVEENRWKLIQPMRDAVSCPSVTAYNNRLYVIGGVDESLPGSYPAIQCYNVATSNWSIIRTMKVEKKGYQSVLLNDLIYIVGGSSRQTFVYDPQADKALEVALVNEMHLCAGATVLNGKIYLTGGDTVVAKTSKTVECYSPEEDRWRILKDCPVPNPVYWHGCVTVLKNIADLKKRCRRTPLPTHPIMLFRGVGEADPTFDPR